MERMSALLDLAKSKKNVLEITEINNFFKDIDLTEERIEKIIEFWNKKMWMFYRFRMIKIPMMI